MAADPATETEIQRLREDLEWAGASPTSIDQVVAKLRDEAAAPDVFHVYGVNASAVRVFDAMRTQWLITPLSTMASAELVRTGLRYEVLDRVVRGLGIEEQPGDFDRLRLMEAEAILAWAGARK